MKNFCEYNLFKPFKLNIIVTLFYLNNLYFVLLRPNVGNIVKFKFEVLKCICKYLNVYIKFHFDKQMNDRV